MNVGPAEQVFEEVLPYLETLDAQIGGIVQLLKDKGITSLTLLPLSACSTYRANSSVPSEDGMPIFYRCQASRL